MLSDIKWETLAEEAFQILRYATNKSVFTTAVELLARKPYVAAKLVQNFRIGNYLLHSEGVVPHPHLDKILKMTNFQPVKELELKLQKLPSYDLIICVP